MVIYYLVGVLRLIIRANLPGRVRMSIRISGYRVSIKELANETWLLDAYYGSWFLFHGFWFLVLTADC